MAAPALMSRRATNPTTMPPAVASPVSAAVCGNVICYPLKYEIKVAAIHPTYNYRDIGCND